MNLHVDYGELREPVARKDETVISIARDTQTKVSHKEWGEFEYAMNFFISVENEPKYHDKKVEAQLGDIRGELKK